MRVMVRSSAFCSRSASTSSSWVTSTAYARSSVPLGKYTYGVDETAISFFWNVGLVSLMVI